MSEVFVGIRVCYATRYGTGLRVFLEGEQRVNVEGGLRSCQHGIASGSGKHHIGKSHHLLTVALWTHGLKGVKSPSDNATHTT